jgi:CheY-like chemotaxis protein
MNAPSLLLAEDDAVLADALVTQLTLAGFRVEHAPNGAVAEFLLLRQPFDAAVLDLGLPLVDGLTVLKRVRVAKPALPVLMLTALDGLDSRVAGFQAGADDYLTKPFDFPELELRLRALLRRSRPADAGGSQLGGLLRPRRAPRHHAWRGGGPEPARVDAAGPAAGPARPGGHQGADRPGLERGSGQRGRLDRGLHPPPAPQARRLGPGDPHGARPGLPARGRGA